MKTTARLHLLFRPTSWERAAACASPDIDADVFFADERDHAQVEEARKVCSTCPVRAACITAALQDGDVWGIRGGLTHRQRQGLLRKNQESIPRAVSEATDDITVLLRHIYEQHVRPVDGGHLLWTDPRTLITVRKTSYPINRLAYVAVHGREPAGPVYRTCAREGCVARACLEVRRPHARTENTRPCDERPAGRNPAGHPDLRTSR